jgi:hypothetical protein
VNTWNLNSYTIGNPINFIDPTGHWADDIHKEFNDFAIKRKKRKIMNRLSRHHKVKTVWDKVRLNAGNLLIDDEKGTYPGDSAWHGHGSSSTIQSNQLDLAKRAWDNKNYAKAFYEIGKALHAIQDFTAHTINGKAAKEYGATTNTEPSSYIKNKFKNRLKK